MEPSSSSLTPFSNAPFSGLVISVTGFSKEARKQIMEATERLGGKYSPSLHSGCTHLLVKSVRGHKLEHAFKYRFRTGLFIVTFQWFVDCVMRNVRLRESPYSVQTVKKTIHEIAESCDTVHFNYAFKPAEMIGEHFQSSDMAFQENDGFCLARQKIYIDSDVSAELQSKVVEAANEMGAIITDKWLAGCGASYVVCEGPSILRYLGHVDNIVTPIWVLKTAKERSMQRFTRFSADLAREVKMLLENLQDGIAGQDKLTKKCPQDVSVSNISKADAEQRQKIVHSAKISIRNRRHHGMQVSLHAITPRTLLGSICWSISQRPSTATIYSDASAPENIDAQASGFHNAKDDEKQLDATFSNFSRPLNESEKNELILRHHFITILFPVDRFSEMGPSSRTFYSDKGFTCLQMLDLIYAFYQENMSDHEIEAAIHTDSRHADHLRAIYSDEQTAEFGHISYKRIDFMGSRRSFEMLKRISGDNTGNVYELVIGA